MEHAHHNCRLFSNILPQLQPRSEKHISVVREALKGPSIQSRITALVSVVIKEWN